MRLVTDAAEGVAGGKARVLLRLRGSFPIPPFAVVALHDDEIGDLDEHELCALLQREGVDPPFAVRSTFAREDSESHAYAGVFETCLNVVVTDLAEAVRKVLQSVEASRVTEYLLGTDAPPPEGGPETAVLIQAMCAADAAGVCFTADSSGDTRECRVEAIRGLGDALVSGLVEPDAFRFDRVTGELRQYLPGRQQLVRSASGDYRLNQTDALSRKISTSTARRVLHLALRVEQALQQSPIDIEWCVVGGDIFLLQARPLTVRE